MSLPIKSKTNSSETEFSGVDFQEFYEPTLNQMGFMLTKIDPFAQGFLQNLSKNEHNLESIDIGAAYGIVTLEAMKMNKPVIANDISLPHLLALQQRAQAQKLVSQKVRIQPGNFFDLDIKEGSLFSIYISRVLHFLKGEKIIEALNTFEKWLIPGGKLFVINETPFFGSAKDYLPTYYEKKRTGHPWPGLVEDLAMFDPHKKPFVQGTIHLLDEDTCLKCIKKTALSLDSISYYNRRGYFPPDALYDGRESIGFVLSKQPSKEAEY